MRARAGFLQSTGPMVGCFFIMIIRVRLTAAVVLLAGLASTLVAASHPLDFLPLAISLGLAEQTRLNAGEAIVEMLPSDGRDAAMFAVTRVSADGDRLMAWMRQVEDLRKGPYVSSISRFSRPPRIEDLDRVVLDDEDLNDLQRCRPRDCGVKLSDGEIAHLRQVIAAAGPNWKLATQEAFRGIIFDRVEGYLAAGHSGAPPYHDEDRPVFLGGEFMLILETFRLANPPFLQLKNYLVSFPYIDGAHVESFLYWSKESFGAKPIISVTHVAMVKSKKPNVPEVVVASKQVYATHYMTGSLSLTAITGGAQESPRYLVYLNHSRADVFDGVFGGFVRRMVERRLRKEVPAVLQGLRRRLESGDP